MNSTYYKNQVIQICSDYAGVAHIGQLRKDKITPYITHPARVAGLTSVFLKDYPNVLYIYVAAAWIHDVMEDCSEIVEGEFSYIINNHPRKTRNIFRFLTMNDKISPVDGKLIFELAHTLTMSQNKSISKEDRKKDYYSNMLTVDPAAVIIKYCDRIDNLTTAHIFTQNGFKWYIEDTESMMSILEESRDTMRYPAYKALTETLEATKSKYKEMYE